jgi:glycosyltransferase involved in cell wall biosynthesis
MGSKKFAFVLPRYFEGIAGGAETLMGNLAQQLHKRGDHVELWATCAKDNRTWENDFAPGVTHVDGITLRRFSVDPRNLDVWVPLQLALHDEQTLSVDDQLEWMAESVNSKALYEHIERHSQDFDAVFFGPYLFGTTFWGSLIEPRKSILIPCLHDETYAYQEAIASMFRQVKGCLFNAEPEMELARSLYGDIPGDVVGMGFEPPSAEDVASLSPYFDESFPYILYLGRKETGKNVHVLLDEFVEAKNAGLIAKEVKLAILGGGSFSDLHRQELLARKDIIDLPHLSERDKQRLLRHALFLCQPSTNESFSIVIMEAWMVGTPVVVHGECAVTRHHVEVSGGGLYFTSAEDLGGVTEYFLSNSERRVAHAQAGAEYVAREYSWSAVLSRFDRVVSSLQQGSSPSLNDGNGSQLVSE